MSFFNRVMLIGRLTKDPELRETPQGTQVAHLRLAVNRPRTRSGEQNADFFDVVVWDKLADICHRMLHKGRLIFVEGVLRQRSYTDKQGQNRYVVEVVGRNVRFLDKRGESTGESSPPERTGTISLNDAAEGSVSDPLYDDLGKEDA